MAAPVGNRYAVGNNGGRPPIYESSDELAKAVDEYFIYILGESHEEKDEKSPDTPAEQIWDRYPEPATITGLTLYLGFSDRQSLYDYQEKKEFSGIIKKARARVEHEYEKRLLSDKPTGPIFALKNMGWADKSTVEHQGGISLTDVPITFK